MVVAKHIRDLLAFNSKAEMTGAVMILLDQVAKLDERNSRLTEHRGRELAYASPPAQIPARGSCLG